MECGICFYGDSVIQDSSGCHLGHGHDSPHEFIDTYNRTWQWETDWECTCEDCLSDDPDFCSIYWLKA